MRRQLRQWILAAAVISSTSVTFAAGTAAPAPAPVPGTSSATGSNVMAQPAPTNSVYTQPVPPNSATNTPAPLNSVYTQPVPPNSATNTPAPLNSVWSAPAPLNSAWNAPIAVPGNTTTPTSNNGQPSIITNGVPLPPNTVVGNPNGPGVIILNGGGVVSPADGIPLNQLAPTNNISIPSSASPSGPGSIIGGSGASNAEPARVEPAGAYRSDNSDIRGMSLGATRHAEIQGQLVDLYAITQSNSLSSAPGLSKSSQTISTEVQSVSAPPARVAPRGVNVQVITAGLQPTSTPLGVVASVDPVAGGPSLGADARPETIRSTVANTTTVRSVDGGITMTTSAPRIDTSKSSLQLKNGVPAAIMVGSQVYVLVCDPRQLSSYAGQNVRVSGTINGSGMLVPDRLEVKNGADFREVALTLPGSIRSSDGSRFATERE